MAFSLKHHATGGDVTHTLAEWGISNVVATEGGWRPGKLSFDIAGEFDADAPFAYGDRVTLLEGSTVRWTGRIRQLPQIGKGMAETRRFVAEDVIGDLARRQYQQGWMMWTGVELAEQLQPALVLFRDVNAAAVSLATQIPNIITAAAAAGIDVQMGDCEDMAATPFGVTVQMQTYLDALQACVRFGPDTVPQIDHTTTPPTIHFIRRINATERDIAVITAVDAFQAEPLYDQQVSGVIIHYQRDAVIDGQVFTEAVTDVAPEGADADDENTLVLVHQLRAATPAAGVNQTQDITTEAIESDSFDFWERLWPELADRNESATLTDDEIDGDPDEDRMILDGAQPAWTGSAATVTVRATFNGIINGKIYAGKQLIARVNASTLTSGTYTQDGGSTGSNVGDTLPSGLAALLYSALHPLQYNGQITRTVNTLSWTVKPGDAVNFTGTEDSALTTARASVQSVTRDLAAGVETIEFGALPILQFNDLIDLLKQQASLNNSRELERAGEPRPTVEGAGMGPGSSLVPTADIDLHPFAVVKVDETVDETKWIVIPGTVNNVIPTIGGTSLAVLPAPQLTVAASGTKLIVLNINATLTKLDDVYVETAVVSTVTITVETTNPGPEGLISTAGTFHLVLATIVDGVRTSQEFNTSLSAQIVDDGSSDGAGELFIV